MSKSADPITTRQAWYTKMFFSYLSFSVLQRRKLVSFLDCVQMSSRTNKIPNNINCEGGFLNLNMYSNSLNESEKAVDKEN